MCGQRTGCFVGTDRKTAPSSAGCYRWSNQEGSANRFVATKNRRRKPKENLRRCLCIVTKSLFVLLNFKRFLSKNFQFRSIYASSFYPTRKIHWATTTTTKEKKKKSSIQARLYFIRSIVYFSAFNTWKRIIPKSSRSPKAFINSTTPTASNMIHFIRMADRHFDLSVQLENNQVLVFDQ